jgi:hypothetical protein
VPRHLQQHILSWTWLPALPKATAEATSTAAATTAAASTTGKTELGVEKHRLVLLLLAV